MTHFSDSQSMLFRRAEASKHANKLSDKFKVSGAPPAAGGGGALGPPPAPVCKGQICPQGSKAEAPQ